MFHSYGAISKYNNLQAILKIFNTSTIFYTNYINSFLCVTMTDTVHPTPNDSGW